MVSELTEFAIGEEVERLASPGERGRVVEEPRNEEYRVKWSDGSEAWVKGEDIRKAETSFAWRRHGDFLADLALLKFEYKFSDVVFSMGSSRTQFLPYQFKPVLQFIQQQPHGLLIADEVGLGKTIEAALIARELIARGAVSRILVICPANLREKWRQELGDRFGIELRDLRPNHFQEFKERYEREGYWPPFRGVISLEGLRNTNFEDTLIETGIHFDLVIVDEAHHMRNPRTRSFALGEALSAQADHILLLSATPVQTGEGDLLSLLRLVEPAEFQDTSAKDLTDRLEPNRYINAATTLISAPNPELGRVMDEMSGALNTYHGSAFAQDQLYMDWLRRLEYVDSLAPEMTVRLRRDLQNVHTLAPYYTRTRKREVQDIAQRKAQTMRVTLTEEERDFYEAWNTFVRTEAVLRDVHPAFYVVQPERQAASSIHAVRERVENRIEGARNRVWAEADKDDYEGESDMPEPEELLLFSRNSGFPVHFEDAVERLREAAGNLPAHDSKVDIFVNTIKELLKDKPKRKIICFTEWRATLRHLQSRLNSEGIPCLGISGQVPPRDRHQQIDKFRNGTDIRVLLSTEVGSEGLDFQFCDAVINFDLPWNPMRVEQRIGRIDRFGQEEDQVIVVSLFVEETIDTRVLSRLYDRIGVFEGAIGQLEPILGPKIASLQQIALDADLSPAEQERRTNDKILQIEQEKLDLERLDDQQAELMGQGDLLRKEAENARETGRYISVAEVQSLVTRWLRGSQSKLDHLDTTRRPHVFDLHLSEGSLAQVSSWMLRQKTQPTESAAGHAPLLDRLREARHGYVTFDSEVARENPMLPFLHSGHEIVATAIETAGSLSNWASRVGRTAMPEWMEAEEPEIARDGIVLAIYRITLRGLEKQTTMLPIAISAASGNILPGLSERLLGALPQGDAAGGSRGIDEQTIRLVEEHSHAEASRRAKDATNLAREQQESRVAVQTTTLTRSYRSKIRRSRELASSATKESIHRLHEGRAHNLEAELQDKIAQLQSAPEPTAEFDLIAMVAFVPLDQ